MSNISNISNISNVKYFKKNTNSFRPTLKVVRIGPVVLEIGVELLGQGVGLVDVGLEDLGAASKGVVHAALDLGHGGHDAGGGVHEVLDGALGGEGGHAVGEADALVGDHVGGVARQLLGLARHRGEHGGLRLDARDVRDAQAVDELDEGVADGRALGARRLPGRGCSRGGCWVGKLSVFIGVVTSRRWCASFFLFYCRFFVSFV